MRAMNTDEIPMKRSERKFRSSSGILFCLLWVFHRRTLHSQYLFQSWDGLKLYQPVTEHLP